jgi:hypothetical protein
MNKPSKEDKNAYYEDLLRDFNNMILGDIKKVHNKTAMSSLILMLCAIDCLKTYRYGLEAVGKTTLNSLKLLYPKNKNPAQHKYLQGIKPIKTREAYVDFLKEYLRSDSGEYDPESIYVGIRCGLIHSYTENPVKKRGQDKAKRKGYLFTDNRKMNNTIKHLMVQLDLVEKEKEEDTELIEYIYFNIDVFYLDFLKMCSKFFEHAKSNNEIKENIFHVKSYLGRMTPRP